MARVYRQARGGLLESGEASKLVFVLAAIGKLIEASDLEERLEALENASENTA